MLLPVDPGEMRASPVLRNKTVSTGTASINENCFILTLQCKVSIKFIHVCRMPYAGSILWTVQLCLHRPSVVSLNGILLLVLVPASTGRR